MRQVLLEKFGEICSREMSKENILAIERDRFIQTLIEIEETVEDFQRG